MTEHKTMQIDISCGIMPFSLLKVVHALQGLSRGDILEILGSDPETKQELFAVLDPESFEIVDVVQEKDDARLRLRKSVQSETNKEA